MSLCVLRDTDTRKLLIRQPRQWWNPWSCDCRCDAGGGARWKRPIGVFLPVL